MAIQSLEFEMNLAGVTSSSTSVGGTIKAYGTGSGSYGGAYYTYSANDPDGTITMNTLTDGVGSSTIATGLTPGVKYSVRIREYPSVNLGGTASSYYYFQFTVPQITDDILNAVATVTEEYDGEELPDTAVELNSEIGLSKSLLQVHTDTSDAKSMSAALKSTGIQVTQSLPAYYSFGTTLFFTPTDTASKQSGGIGFFINGAAETGYFILVKTSGTAGLVGDEFSILKISGKVVKKLEDSQKITNSGKGIGVYAGQTYKVDIKVKVESTKTIIQAYINGSKITATDRNVAKTSTKKADPYLARTDKVALFANLGTVNFDYVYAMPITEDQYATSLLESIYGTQFSSMTSNLAYGDMFVTGLGALDTSTNLKYIEEFGPVAREIRKVKQRYERYPAYPKYIYPNLNTGVQVLDATLGSFGTEMYLMNSSGTTKNVDSGNFTQISVLGSNLVRSEDLIYKDDEINKFEVQEPISFKTLWLQSQTDAANLSSWIKEQWSKQQRVIDLVIFGNPLISVGDIVTIDYAYHELTTALKFVVTDVTQTWSEGLETTISVRSIYS